MLTRCKRLAGSLTSFRSTDKPTMKASSNTASVRRWGDMPNILSRNSGPIGRDVALHNRLFNLLHRSRPCYVAMTPPQVSQPLARGIQNVTLRDGMHTIRHQCGLEIVQAIARGPDRAKITPLKWRMARQAGLQLVLRLWRLHRLGLDRSGGRGASDRQCFCAAISIMGGQGRFLTKTNPADFVCR